MRTTLHHLCILMTLLGGVHSAFAQVTNLGIAPAGGQSLLYWPNSPTNYVLQSVTNLSSTNWVTARTAFTVNAAVVTNASPAGYFQLMPVTVPAGMALVPAGWFTMGNSIGDSDITNANPTNVYVSAFVMDLNLVNYGLWTNVYAYATNNNYFFEDVGANLGTGTNYPVVAVDWYDCVKWCNARSQQAGLTPVYYADAGFTQVFTNGDAFTPVYQNLAVNGYRLPTEAEWEKAARGGGIGLRFPWGNLISESQANYYGDTNDYSYDRGPNGWNAIGSRGPSPVGSFDVNGYGLYDMAGNVAEWCWDLYGTPYGQPSDTNPTGPAGPSSARVARGGDFSDYADLVRCAYRAGVAQFGGGNNLGFRCVRGL